MKTLIGFITLITLFSFTKEDNLSQLQFLEGTWKMENKENYETWKTISKRELDGSSYKIRAEKKTITEYLNLNEANSLEYRKQARSAFEKKVSLKNYEKFYSDLAGL